MLPVMEEENAFAKRMNGLVGMVLQDVHLQFTLPSTSGVVSSVYSYSYGGASECDGSIGQAFSHGEGGKSVSLGDLYVDEVRQLLVELKVPKAALLECHAMSNISIMCSYRDPLTRDVIRKPLIMPIPTPLQSQDQNQRQTNSQSPVLLRSFSSSSSTRTAQSNRDDQQQLRNLFVTTRAVAESRRLVELSDLDTAIHLLSSARSLLLQHSTTAVVSNTQKKLVLRLEAELQDLQRVQQEQHQQQRRSPSHRRWSEQALLGEARGGGGEPLTPTSAWRAAEQLAKVAITRKSLNRVSDLHGLENARF
ncbi:uncharacterized protein A4U43_UnF10680 [Asparagus officinalis]|uniref:E3 ubiquitin-protein ligase WAV3-like C-terminal domain-containing protein n=1 Tax=Asparagus officinalis TaxID=4686 RepID=A0A1R3L5E1_ASPOF|nr:uncharacterized protein A4U43_UnF10680 [Asparagus officinalis]